MLYLYLSVYLGTLIKRRKKGRGECGKGGTRIKERKKSRRRMGKERYNNKEEEEM